MKRLTLFALLALCLATGPVWAADAPAAKSAAGVKKASLPTKRSLAEKGGRFHAVHKAQKLQCSDCHSKTEVDPLFLRASESQGSEGPVDRAACMDCHKSPDKPTWYLGLKK
jgi:uncharacterized membrane protein